jgi:hypothetical protein
MADRSNVDVEAWRIRAAVTRVGAVSMRRHGRSEQRRHEDAVCHKQHGFGGAHAPTG